MRKKVSLVTMVMLFVPFLGFGQDGKEFAGYMGQLCCGRLLYTGQPHVCDGE